MRTFTNQTAVSAIKRMTYTGDKSAYSSVGTSTCYFRPLSEKQAADNSLQYGNAFSAIFETDQDVRAADVLTIGGTDYTVQGIVNHNRGRVGYIRAILTKPAKA